MKLLQKLAISSAALFALCGTAAYANTVVLIPNGHGSYSIIESVPDSSAMIGLSVNGSGGSNTLGNSACPAGNGSCSSMCMDRAHGSSAVYTDTAVTFRDNAHGTQVPR